MPGNHEDGPLAAEAIKQEAILTAEGEAKAIEEVADAERYRQLTVAEGEAEAVRSVYGAIHDGNPTPDLLAIKYLEALGTVADGRATKIFLPADMSATLGSLGAIAELFTGEAPETDQTPEATPAPEATPSD